MILLNKTRAISAFVIDIFVLSHYYLTLSDERISISLINNIIMVFTRKTHMKKHRCTHVDDDSYTRNILRSCNLRRSVMVIRKKNHWTTSFKI